MLVELLDAAILAFLVGTWLLEEHRRRRGTVVVCSDCDEPVRCQECEDEEARERADRAQSPGGR